ncbi:MAG: cytidine deaminase [Actinomycetes bacterium]
MTATSDPLSAEDAKLVTLARAARARTSAHEGAAVRDDTGRTYMAGSVALPSLRLSALQAAVAAAVSSGADRLEAAVVCSTATAPAGADLALLGDLGGAATLLVAPDGTVTWAR